MKTKVCSICKKGKTVDEFNINRATRNGFDYRCKACHSIYNKKWRKKNVEHCKQYYKKWGGANAERIKQYVMKWQNKNRQTPRGGLNYRMRRLIRHCSSGQRQASPTLESLIGYTPQDVRKHFESLFTEGMTWDNHGEWEIDHIKPICSFDYDSPDDPEFQKCWALSNLQPLWHEDNVKKGRKIL